MVDAKLAQTKRIAVLGSAFDPPTLGHADVIQQCLNEFDEVWLVPAFHHAFDKKMSDYAHRVKLLSAFIEDIQLAPVLIQACEDKIKSQGKIYSIDLMHYLETQIASPHEQLFLIIGPDNEKVFHQFKDSDLLKKRYSPFIVKERLPIRSTLVRRAIQTHTPLEQLITPRVATYIKTHGLY